MPPAVVDPLEPEQEGAEEGRPIVGPARERAQRTRLGGSVQWELVVGPQLRRFLRICDPDNLLPLGDSAVDHPDAVTRDRELLVGRDH